MNKNYLKLFLTVVIGLPILYYETIDLVFPSAGTPTHIISFMLWVVLVILSGVATFVGVDFDVTKESSLPSWLRILSNIVIVLAIVFVIPYKGIITFYNTSSNYKYAYNQKCQERPGFYDAMWKTYSQKTELKNMNEILFVNIATIIMDGRKDGAAVSWKWVKENTQIPFTEFSRFYVDLSSYIERERKGYFELEKECQRLAYAHNAYIKVFPNNLYNVFIGKRPLEYKYGFTSDSTQRVFATGVENLR